MRFSLKSWTTVRHGRHLCRHCTALAAVRGTCRRGHSRARACTKKEEPRRTHFSDTVSSLTPSADTGAEAGAPPKIRAESWPTASIAPPTAEPRASSGFGCSTSASDARFAKRKLDAERWISAAASFFSASSFLASRNCVAPRWISAAAASSSWSAWPCFVGTPPASGPRRSSGADEAQPMLPKKKRLWWETRFRPASDPKFFSSVVTPKFHQPAKIPALVLYGIHAISDCDLARI